jgi:nucleoside 2-deoxyribosyltransferase
MSEFVYLVGPISGLSYAEATEWRVYAAAKLAEYGVTALDPMRDKAFLEGERILGNNYSHTLARPKGITVRDRNDVFRADAILANFLTAKKCSCGSPIEFGWADAKQKTVVMVTSEDNPFNHAMMREIAGFVVDDLDEGIDVVLSVLGKL